jgi:hypothetical protein
MKKIFFGLMILGVCVTTANAQASSPSGAAPQSSAPAASISFKEKDNTHDFGKVPQGTPVTYNFNFVNTGKAPLVLSSVQPSCGCTSPEWPKEPIAPGAAAVIKVTYNAANPGVFTKNVTVVSNSATPQTVLYIKGEVITPAASTNQAAPAPVKASTPVKN